MAQDTPARDRAHAHLMRVSPVLPTDYADYGGDVARWERADAAYPDCSMGCAHAITLDGDWLVCGKVGGPRMGMLTFEHQAGHGCHEPGPERVTTQGGLVFATP